MGLFQDQTNSLSELKRLAALVPDPSRRNEIGADQWPLAMIAYGLVTCNDKNRLPEGLEIYALFQSFCAPDARRKSALQLAAFIKQRKGDGWRSLLPFILADSDAAIRRQAAFLCCTLAAPTPDERFPGVAAIVSLICAEPLPGQQSMAPALEALMSLGDLRFAPYLATISSKLPAEKLATLLAETSAAPTALGCEWLADTLTKRPEPVIATAIAAALCAMPSKGKEVMDVVVPIPTWQFTSSTVMPLHSWTLPEYWLRMKERLSSDLPPELLDAVAQAWQ